MADMITKGKDSTRGKSVLLFSGGMDSLMMDHLLNPDYLLTIYHGQKYEAVEGHHIASLVKHEIIDRHKIIVDLLGLGKFERDDAIIPCRNLYFILLAANYGEAIYLGSMYGDRSLDKSPEFFQKAEDMLNFLYQEQHWCEKREFQVLAPYKNLTKTELVTLYLEKGGNPEHLLKSYSCYEGGMKPCGWCKPCFRKWVSLVNNQINCRGYFINSPWTSPWLPHLIPLMKEQKYRQREDVETMKALNMKGVK